jgi:hypothetical protein
MSHQNRVLFVYSNIPGNPGKSHTGLKNNALNSLRVLRRSGIRAGMLGIDKVSDLTDYLTAHPCPHVIIQALFLKNDELQALCANFGQSDFAVVCHSSFPFLSSGEINLLYANMNLAVTTPNLVVACNSANMCEDLQQSRRQDVTYLPNLYPLNPEKVGAPRVWRGGVLRGGFFCSPREAKNPKNNAVGFAIMCQKLGCDGVFMYNVGRTDGGPSSDAARVVQSIENILAPYPRITTMPISWQDQPDHLITVGSCDLAFQASFHETFNIVTCDAISQGVASVVSPAVKFAPDSWKAQPDSAVDIARVGMSLIYNASAVEDGVVALQQHNAQGIYSWRAYLFDGVTNVGPQAMRTSAMRNQPLHDNKGLR